MALVRPLALGAACVLLLALHTSAQQPQPPALPRFLPGRLLVQFRPEVSGPERDARLAAIAASVVRRFEAIDVEHVSLPPGLDVETAARVLELDPSVLSVQPDYERQIVATSPPNDPYWMNGELWGLQKIQIKPVWDSFGGGDATVVIADIDTGVNYLHPDLAPNMWRNPFEIPGNGVDDERNGYIDDIYGIDTYNGDSDPMDDRGHGTHTAGTFAAAGNNGIGVAGANWNAKILACKFLNAAGSGSDSGAVACFNYLVGMRNRGVNVRISSNSWGGPRGGSVPAVLQAAIDAAGNVGILNVFAAGNSGVNTDVTPFDPASLSSPSIVSVAASDSNDNRAGFSNYGATSVDLAAPGVSILSTHGSDYAYFSGTSMATPHVAGVAGLLLSLKPSLSVQALKGHLLDNVSKSAQWTSVVASGGRLDAYLAVLSALPNVPPTVSMTNPVHGGSFTAPANIVVAATAVDSDGSITQVSFYAGATLLATDTTAPYSVTWNSVPAGTYTVRAEATDNGGATASASADIAVVAAGGSQAAFVGTDTTTKGTWQGVYGNQGYVLANAAANLPGGMTVTASGHANWTWAGTTSDPRALQIPGGGSRIAATWYAGSSFQIDVQPGDSTQHRVALYLLDWDNAGRGERIEVLDLGTGATLDTRTATGFQGGQYLIWTVTGPVRVRVTRTAGVNAVMSALFVDPVASPPPPSPPPGGSTTAVFAATDTTTQGNWPGVYGSQGYTLAQEGTSLPAGAAVTVTGHQSWTWADSTSDARAPQRSTGLGRIAATWYANSFTIAVNVPDGQAHRVALYMVDWDATGREQRIEVQDAVTGTMLDTRSVSSFQGGQYWVWAVTGAVQFRVTRTSGANAVVSAVFVDAAGGSAPPIATFRRTDTTTQGTWSGIFGTAGYTLAQDGTSLPTGVTVTPMGHQSWTWAATTSDARALQQASGTGRVAATWYGATFTIDVGVSGVARNVALYVVDWDNNGRAEQVEVLDSATGAVIDTRTVSVFNGGQYWIWTVRSAVRFRITKTAGSNAVVSAVFIDPES